MGASAYFTVEVVAVGIAEAGEGIKSVQPSPTAMETTMVVATTRFELTAKLVL